VEQLLQLAVVAVVDKAVLQVVVMVDLVVVNLVDPQDQVIHLLNLQHKVDLKETTVVVQFKEQVVEVMAKLVAQMDQEQVETDLQ
tara:strand:+ start:224 stop:478 length:255 start_codon:yes stop_codon:yes gene_type:complete